MSGKGLHFLPRPGLMQEGHAEAERPLRGQAGGDQVFARKERKRRKISPFPIAPLHRRHAHFLLEDFAKITRIAKATARCNMCYRLIGGF